MILLTDILIMVLVLILGIGLFTVQTVSEMNRQLENNNQVKGVKNGNKG